MSISTPKDPLLTVESGAMVSRSVDVAQAPTNRLTTVSPLSVLRTHLTGPANNPPGIPQHVSALTVGTTVGKNSVQARLTFLEPSDPNYTRTNVYATGYKGSKQPVLVGSGRSPVSVSLDNTGENVVLTTVSTGNAGEASFANAPNSGITLGQSKLGGYGVLTAQTALNLDQLPNGSTYLKSPQYSGSSLVIDNPTATNGTVGWEGQNGGETIAVDTTTAPGSATQSFKVHTRNQFDGERTIRAYACRAGDIFAIDCWLKSDGTASAYCQILFFNVVGTSIGQVISSATTSTSWVHLSAQNIAPAGTVYAIFSVINGNATPGSQTFWFWGPHIARQLQSQNLAPANASSISTTVGAILSQSGATSTILVAAFSVQYPFGQVSYNSGSVNPGSTGTYIVYFSDPAYQGGTVTYQATNTGFASISNDGNTVVGKITTTGGGGGTGPNGGGGANVCFSPNTRVQIRGGVKRIDEIAPLDRVLTAAGTWRPVHFKTESDYRGYICDMGNGELVTPGHTILRDYWIPAKDLGFPNVWYEGKVYNLHVEAHPLDDPRSPNTEHSYTLANGYVVHNYIMPC